MKTKKAVVYGAGNIGRGFIGQLLFESGYHTTFIDINDDIINELNRRGEYPLRIIANNSVSDLQIGNARAVNVREIECVAWEIAGADLAATAVGAGILRHISPSMALGLQKRFEVTETPLDILVCENLMDAGGYLRDLIKSNLPECLHSRLNAQIGFIETSIGRMVPIQTPELQDGDRLRICTEAHCSLPVDSDAFKSGIPEIRGIVPFSPFSFYKERKLFIHNMGHALAAYCGDYLGCTYIQEALENTLVFETIRNAMNAAAQALVIRYGADENELYAHVEDLLERFANRRLGDTVYRVGRDLRRKLSHNDRMVGALRICEEYGFDCRGIIIGIALALRFSGNDLDLPPMKTLTEICGIKETEPVYKSIKTTYEAAVKNTGLIDIHSSLS